MKKQTIAQKSIYWLKVISLGLILGLGIQFAEAWTSPTLPPPNGKVSGPLTTGAAAQYKTGMLGVNSITAPVNALEVGGGGSAYIGGSVNATSGTVTGVLTAGKVQIVDVVIENSPCAKGVVVGTVARDSNGVLLSCQGPGVLRWKKASGEGGAGCNANGEAFRSGQVYTYTAHLGSDLTAVTGFAQCLDGEIVNVGYAATWSSGSAGGD